MTQINFFWELVRMTQINIFVAKVFFCCFYSGSNSMVSSNSQFDTIIKKKKPH
jgi:hypothetical protein